jgi:hypothetical protein
MSISSADMQAKNRKDIISLPTEFGDVPFELNEACDWLACVGTFLQKPRLKARGAVKIVKGLKEAGYDTWSGLAKMSAEEYMSAGGMIAGDAAAVFTLLHEDDTVSQSSGAASMLSNAMSNTQIGEFVVKASAESAGMAFKAMQATKSLPCNAELPILVNLEHSDSQLPIRILPYLIACDN